MNINELKKLINQEVKKYRLSEATEPGTPKAKIKAAQSTKTPEPSATTIMKDMPKDPAVSPPQGRQPKATKEIENPEDFYKGIMRLHNALRDRFQLEMNDEEVYEIIREITSEEIEKARSKYPEHNLGSRLA